VLVRTTLCSMLQRSSLQKYNRTAISAELHARAHRTKLRCTPSPRCFPLHSRHMKHPYETEAHCGFLVSQSQQTCERRGRELLRAVPRCAQDRSDNDRTRTLFPGSLCKVRRTFNAFGEAIAGSPGRQIAGRMQRQCDALESMQAAQNARTMSCRLTWTSAASSASSGPCAGSESIVDSPRAHESGCENSARAKAIGACKHGHFTLLYCPSWLCVGPLLLRR
jgi:hypothetical protein